jgi:hypothetical protein
MNNQKGISFQAMIGFVILFVFVTIAFRACTDRDFDYRHRACTQGSRGFAAVFKSLFVCLWV